MLEESRELRIAHAVFDVECERDVVERIHLHHVVVVPQVVEQRFLIRQIPVVLQVVMHSHGYRLFYCFEGLHGAGVRLRREGRQRTFFAMENYSGRGEAKICFKSVSFDGSTSRSFLKSCWWKRRRAQILYMLCGFTMF